MELYSTILGGKQKSEKRRMLPPLVISRAKTVGAVGEAWLAGLDNMISELEKEWHISVGEALSGGSHAFVAYADGANGEKYILKIDMPENLGGEFSKEMAVLEMANGESYAKLYAYDLKRKACLMERLGKPILQLGYSVNEQIRIICEALQKVWKLSVKNANLAAGGTTWFNEFIEDAYERLDHPCSREVAERAFSYLKSRAESEKPDEFVMLHGDAHGGNALITLAGDGYKLIDPDGIFYEKAYDLGVLMREWREEYRDNPIRKGKERCQYLSKLTGVEARAIFEWGFIQCVSTGMASWNIDRSIGKELLDIAEAWLSIGDGEC